MSTTVVLMLLAMIIIPGLLVVEVVSAQTIPKPSVPEFTAKLVDRSYDEPLIYTNSTDPYTVQQVTANNGGYHWKTLLLMLH